MNSLLSFGPSPRTVEVTITGKCNLDCTYCCHRTSASDVHRDLDTEQWLDFFLELRECGVMYLVFGGGEPFVRSDMPLLIEGVVAANMRYRILTNGTLITDELADFVSATQRCDSIQISIDGAKASSHDLCRGRGTFEKAVQGLEILRDYNLPVKVRVTIHKKNLYNLVEIAKYLLEDLSLQSFSVDSAFPMGKCRQNASSVQLNAREYEIAMQELLRLDNRYRGRIEATSGPLADARRIMKVKKMSAEEKGKKDENGFFLDGCRAFWEKIGVRSDGVMVPCLQLSHIELGRINEDSLSMLWKSNPRLKKLRERKHISLHSFERCQDCEFIYVCGGNCPALCDAISENLVQPGDAGCLKMLAVKQNGLKKIYTGCKNIKRV